MAESILDGTGAGYRAKINSMNMLSTLSASVSLQHYINHKDREAFSIVVQQTPTATDDCFFYLKNSDNMDMNLWNVCLYCAAAEAIEIWSVTGAAVGTDYVPVNFTVGSGKQAQATCKVGNDITGLTKVKLMKRYRLKAGEQVSFEINSGIIIPEDQAIAVYAVTGTALTELCTTIDFHSEL